MDLRRGDVVRSLAGHDKDCLFCVISTEGSAVLLVNGKERKLNSPKRKNIKHVQRAGTSDHPVLLRLKSGQPVGDKEMRKALAAFRDERNQQSRRE